MKHFSFVALMIVLTTVACDNSSSTTAPTTSPATNTYPLMGTVPAAVNGVGQSDFKSFNVGQSGGTVTVTLTSAVETFPNGTLLPVGMGLALGTPTGTTACTLPAGTTPAFAQAGTSFNVALNPGAYCIQVSDQTIQQGPVAYTVVVLSP